MLRNYCDIVSNPSFCTFTCNEALYTMYILKIMIETNVLYPDIDECAIGIAGCHGNSVCINTPGWYHCDCIEGYHSNWPDNHYGSLCMGMSRVLLHSYMKSVSYYHVFKLFIWQDSIRLSSVSHYHSEWPKSLRHQLAVQEVAGSNTTCLINFHFEFFAGCLFLTARRCSYKWNQAW